MWRRCAAFCVDAGSLLGVLVWALGGVWYRDRKHRLGIDVQFDLYGPLLAPLVLCLWFGWRPGGYALPWFERARAWIDAAPERTRVRWVAASIACLTLTQCLAVYLRYRAFLGGMDLAIYANACRNGLFSTMKGDVWLLADHFEPVLLAFTPLCHWFDPALVLLFGQQIAFGLGATGIYALAGRRGWAPGQRWAAAMLYLAFAGTAAVSYYDFHLLTLALGCVPWLWWALEAERYVWAALFALLYMGLKEIAPLSLIGFGAYVLARGPGKRRWLGLAFLVAGATVFALIMKVVYPLFRHGAETMYFAKYYGHLGHNLSEFAHTMLTRPVYFIGTLLTADKVRYLGIVLAPFLFLPLVRPLYWLPIAPALLVNMASNDGNMIARVYHYEAELYPILFAIAVVGFNAARWRNLWLGVMLVAFTGPGVSSTLRHSVPSTAKLRLQALLRKHVPENLAVAAPQRIAAHLTHIPRLYMFDYWQMEEDWKRADIVVIAYPGERLGWYSWSTLQYLQLPRMLPQLELVYQDPQDPRFLIYKVLHPPQLAGQR